MAESNRKGSFWLFEAGQRSLDATWELYQNNTQYGWYAGGGVPAATSLVDRIDFSNDSPTSASPRGGLTTARFYLGAVGNADYGWFGGGQTPAPAAVSNVERIQYSNDSPSAASARGTFPAANSQIGAASNRYYGWFAGGLLPASVSTVLRIDFANDSPVSASIRGPLAVAGGLISGTGNQYYGYFSGGQAAAPAQVSYVQRTDYANDSPTSAVQRGSLSQSRSGTAAVANTNYGWFGGGYIFPATYRSTVDRMDFANDSPTAAVPRGPLTAVKAGTGASGNQNYGWFTGALLPAVVSNVDRIDYSNDTVSASPRGFLTIAKGGHGATSGIASYTGSPVFLSTSTLLTPVANYGWWAGGYIPVSKQSTIDRIDFSNDSPTTASSRGNLTSGGHNATAATSNNYYGWVNQGDSSAIDRVEMSNDTAATTLRGSLPTPPGQDRSAAGNANYGWHSGGGSPGSFTSRVDRLDYANDTASLSARGLVTVARFSGAATSNANYGWHVGGQPGPLSIVDRIDYSNDSPATAGPRSAMPLTITNQAATGNVNYGWFSGGPFSSIYRIDYANDTNSPSSRGKLTATKNNFKGSGNSLYGWVGPANFSDSSIDRIDYSNDTATASARGNLSQARFAMASFSNYVAQSVTTTSSPSPAFYVAPYSYGSSTVGTSGSQTYGWYGHGYSPGSVSSVDRVDFANDTTTASPRGALPTATFSSDTVGNQNYGWWAGGYSGTSATARVDFSNDSAAATVRGFLSAIRFRGGSVSSSNYGWIGFGQPSGSPAPTSIDRIDFSNESPTAASPRGTATVARTDEPGSVSNANYGWFGGGTIGSSAIERINFANDSPTIAASRGFMSRLKGGISSSGNANYGWFALGYDLSTNLYSSIDRLDFSNDTVTNQVRSNGSESRFWASGAGTSNYGWHGSGLPTPTTYTSRIERLDYANDTNGNAQTRSSFTVNRGANAAIANYVK